MLTIETGLNNEILRTVSAEITKNEMPNMVKLGKEMVKYVKAPKNKAVWLAAPQIGINKRIIAVSLMKSWEDDNFKTIMMINPEILEHSEQKNIEVEWCLSVPGEQGKISRWNMIKLRYIDEKWKTQTVIYDDLRARVLQHEIDHINGLLYVDNMETDSVYEKETI